MVDIVLVRHASTAWSGVRYCGTSDPALSITGRAEAYRVAADLASWFAPDARIVSSPARRATATARAVAAAAPVDLTVDVDDRWREADLGVAEGHTFDELVAIDPGLAAALAAEETTIDWPDGESASALATRVAGAWRDVLADARPTVIVTHAWPLLHALALANGRPPDARDFVPPGGVVHLEVPVSGPIRPTVLPSGT
jgi:broad specificity phosphatase PhoE